MRQATEAVTYREYVGPMTLPTAVLAAGAESEPDSGGSLNFISPGGHRERRMG